MKSEFGVLQAQVAQMQREMAGLKRQRWVGWGLFMVVLIAVAVTSATTQTIPIPQDLVCKSLKVVSDNGKEQVIIGTDAEGGFLHIFRNNGKKQAALAVNREYGGYIYLFNKDSSKLRVLK